MLPIDTTDRTVTARVISVAVICLVLVAVPHPALAATAARVEISKQTWWWRTQVDQEIKPPAPPPAPQPDVRRRLDSPHPPGRLPIQVAGTDQKISAVAFDLVAQGVPIGASVTRLVLTLAEANDQEDLRAQLEARKPFSPQSNRDVAVIYACPIQKFWGGTDGAEPYDALNEENQPVHVVPDWETTSCVKGTRKAPTGQDGRWTFDLSSLAATWASDISTNNGVMLVPEVNGAPAEPSQDGASNPVNSVQPPSGDDWQVVLVGNTPTDCDASGNCPTRFVTTSVDYTPPPPIADSGAGTGGTSFGFSDATPAGEAAAPPPAPAPSNDTPSTVAADATNDIPQPTLPAYVWLLIPVGALLLGMVRSVVLEPAGGKRPDGVLAAIRKQNAARHGLPEPDAAGDGPGLWATVRASLKDPAGNLREDLRAWRVRRTGRGG